MTEYRSILEEEEELSPPFCEVLWGLIVIVLAIFAIIGVITYG